MYLSNFQSASTLSHIHKGILLHQDGPLTTQTTKIVPGRSTFQQEGKSACDLTSLIWKITAVVIMITLRLVMVSLLPLLWYALNLQIEI